MQLLQEENVQYFYYVYGLAALIFLSAILLSNTLLVLACAILLFLSVVLLHAWNIINNVLIKKSNIIQMSGQYKISQNLNSLSKRTSNGYRSISISILKMPRSAIVKTEPLKELIDSINEQFEFSIELASADKSKMVENLKTKLRTKEIALARMNAKPYDKVESLKRQIEIISGDIHNLVSGGRPFHFILRLKSISISNDLYQAEADSYKSIENLSNKFSATLGIDYEILSGEKLLAYEVAN